MNTTLEHTQATDEVRSVAVAGDRRKRRRLVAWSIFGILGVLLGSVWAAGFASSTATSGASATSPVVMGTAGTASASPYATLVTAPSALSIGFNGKWGLVPADADMFQIDLATAATPAGETFFASIYLSNVTSGWSGLQLKFVEITAPVGGCTGASLTGATVFSVMNVTSNDAEADFSSLASGSKYCIGVQAINPASDAAGTFLRRPNSGSTPTMPSFVALLNRAS